MDEATITYAALALCYAAYVSVAFCFVALAVAGPFAVVAEILDGEKP